AFPKAPALFWPGQKRPPATDTMVWPVVSGMMLIGSGAWKPGRLGRQSVVVSWLPVGVHALPESGLVVSVLVFQVVSHTFEMHFGHGEAVLPVMYTREDRFRLTLASPVLSVTLP